MRMVGRLFSDPCLCILNAAKIHRIVISGLDRLVRPSDGVVFNIWSNFVSCLVI